MNGSADYTGNVGVWGPFSADDELGYVYLATESPTNDGYGGHRPGDNLYSGSLVCLDIKTGKMIWYKQLIRHDIWDYDMPVHPILIDITVNGQADQGRRPDGEDGVRVRVRPHERPAGVADSRCPGCRRPMYRPSGRRRRSRFPPKPPPFDVIGIKQDDLIDFTPALRQEALQAIEGYRLGARLCAAVARRAEWEQGHDRRAWLRWRRELAIGRGGSGDRLRLRRIGHEAVRGRRGEDRSARSRTARRTRPAGEAACRMFKDCRC